MKKIPLMEGKKNFVETFLAVELKQIAECDKVEYFINQTEDRDGNEMWEVDFISGSDIMFSKEYYNEGDAQKDIELLEEKFPDIEFFES